MTTYTDLLIIFTRNPELGKCKTRLAATVGDGAALAIYKLLLRHTASITRDLAVQKSVYYSEEIWEEDIWDHKIYTKKLQEGSDLGERMHNAFTLGFEEGYNKIVIIGSDLYDVNQKDLEQAFTKLNAHDFVIGPAEDGGYYLLGMRKPNHTIFQDKQWGTKTVLQATLKNLKGDNYTLLPYKNDVDYYEDIKHIKAIHPFLKHIQE